MDFYLSQAFSKHGCFVGYCEGTDDACHTIFYCEMVNKTRLESSKALGKSPVKEDLVEIMRENCSEWEKVAAMIKTLKETDERKLKAGLQMAMLVVEC